MWCLLVCVMLIADGVVEGQKNFTQPKWLTDYVPNIIGGLEYHSNRDIHCTRQGQIYRRHLNNQSLWAVTMHDASTLHFNGLVTGAVYHLGSFDACLGINVPEYSISGRYCIVRMDFQPRLANDSFVTSRNLNESDTILHPGPMESIWRIFEKSKDPRVAAKHDLKFTVCIPSGCNYEDLQTILNEQMLPLMESEGLTVTLDVKETQCITAQDETKFDIPALLFVSVMALLLFTVLLVSFVHGYLLPSEQRDKFKSHWLASFSMLNTGSKLMKNEGLPQLHFLSGMKVLSMFMIIFGHRYLSMMIVPSVNILDIEKKYNDVLEVFLFNGPLIVNSFLLLSGFLTYFKIQRDITKGRSVNVFLYLAYRWARVSGVYLVVILFSALVMPHFISGPGWKFEGLVRYNSCRRNWWTHMLYMNNYYRADEECLLPGWYLAVDMQLFILATIMGYLVSKWRIVEAPLLASLFILSVAVPGVVTYFGGYGPLLRFDLKNIQRYWTQPDYVESYTKTHMRAAPYIMGMITSKIYFKLEERKFTFNKPSRFIMAIATIVIAEGTIFSAWPFVSSVTRPSRLVSALYSSSTKVTWALSMSIYVLGQALGGFGFTSTALGSKIFAPFNNLTLCVLIIHPLLQTYLTLRTKNPITISATLIFWSAAGDIAVSYLLALVLYLVVEAPIISLTSSALRRITRHQNT